jgi:hypothetical protein
MESQSGCSGRIFSYFVLIWELVPEQAVEQLITSVLKKERISIKTLLH